MKEEFNITPSKYEQYVKSWFDGKGYNLKNYNSKLNDKLTADDGIYEIDINITYESFGVEFHVLVECKRYKSAIKREKVQILYQKIQSLGAHKGIICSTSDFQKGAIEFAKKHGIACINIVDGREVVRTKDFGSSSVSQEDCDYFGIPEICGYLKVFEKNITKNCLVTKKHLEYIQKFLEL